MDTLVNNVWLSHPYITSGHNDQDTRLCVSGQERHITHSVLFIGSVNFTVPCMVHYTENFTNLLKLLHQDSQIWRMAVTSHYL